MSITKIILLAGALSTWGCDARAERLWPDHLRLAIDDGASAQAGAATGLTAHTSDLQADYLAGMTAGTAAPAGPATGLPRAAGRWSAVAAEPGEREGDGKGDGDAASAGELIQALNALGPAGVSTADYLSLAPPGLFNGPAPGRGGESDTGRASGSAATGPPLMNFLPIDSAPAAAGPRAEQPPQWALPSDLSEPLTRYLFLAAVVALVAGAGLRHAYLTRRHGAHSLMRL